MIIMVVMSMMVTIIITLSHCSAPSSFLISLATFSVSFLALLIGLHHRLRLVGKVALLRLVPHLMIISSDHVIKSPLRHQSIHPTSSKLILFLTSSKVSLPKQSQAASPVIFLHLSNSPFCDHFDEHNQTCYLSN